MARALMKRRLVVLNKIDQADDELVAAYREELLDAGADEVFAISPAGPASDSCWTP
jgi:GTP-binding protein